MSAVEDEGPWTVEKQVFSLTLDRKTLEEESCRLLHDSERLWGFIDIGNMKRLALRRAEELCDTESVWHLQGVLTLINLPPFYSNGRPRDNIPIRCLRQGLRLHGLDTEAFERAFQAIMDIATLFERTVPTMNPPDFINRDEHGMFIDVSNRYFSTRRDYRGGEPAGFSLDVDPTGALAKMEDDNYYHGEENVVRYFERVVNKLTRSAKMVAVPPVTFKEGDVVELQLTFMLVPLKNSEWKLAPILRCITLLDGQFAQKRIREKFNLKTNKTAQIQKKGLKRRWGVDIDHTYVEEEETTRAKLGRMEVESRGREDM
ncbi:hypothetical protein DFP72DRAFT_988566 [Ephemerocybe angulata]|uniref:Uncharacterized protein n=1 Tax=Ephemerocybe angulata TaxID=980116 RepID=A0A8H6MC51_9AGAR|nr:hypothetical protein DFP72DRAFT_988566 [Tulosesus angulatus]